MARFFEKKLGDLNGVLEDNVRVIQLDPQNKYVTSRPEFLQVRLILERQAPSFFKLAYEKYSLGQYIEAIEVYTQYIDLNCNNSSLYRERGNCYYLLGRYDEATADYNQALRLKPDDLITLAYQSILAEFQAAPVLLELAVNSPPQMPPNNAAGAGAVPYPALPIPEPRLKVIPALQEDRAFCYDYSPKSGLAISRDGKFLMACNSIDGDSGVLVLSPLNNYEISSVYILNKVLTSFAASPSGSHFLICDDDNILCYIEWETKKILSTMKGHSKAVKSLAILAVQGYALSGSLDKTVRLWNLDTGLQLQKMQGHKAEVNSVAMSADGRFALSGSSDNTMCLWNLLTGELIRTFVGHLGPIRSVAFSVGLEGCFLISASDDKTLKIWDPQTGQIIRNLTGHTDVVTSFVCTKEGRFIISGSADKTLRLWSFLSGREIQVFRAHQASVVSLALSEEASFMVSGSQDKVVHYWNLRHHNLCGNQANEALALSPFDINLPPPSKKERCVLL